MYVLLCFIYLRSSHHAHHDASLVLANSISVLLYSGAGAFLLCRYKPAIRLWDDSATPLADLNATQHALTYGTTRGGLVSSPGS
ncbi:hypothetical protein ABZP36_026971 [Zizania latifolia]